MGKPPRAAVRAACREPKHGSDTRVFGRAAGRPPGRPAARAACREPKHGSGKKHSILSAATRVQAWSKSQRQRSWQPESSISDVEAVCRGQVNNLRNREFQGEMKVQKHLEIDVSAGLSLGRHTRPQQFPVENFTVVLHQLSERSDSKSPHLRDLRKTQKHHIFFRELQVFWSLSLRRLASRLGQKVKDREAGNLNLRFLMLRPCVAAK